MTSYGPRHILLIEPDCGASRVTRAIVLQAAPRVRLTLEPDAEVAHRRLALLLPDVVIIDPSPALPASMQLIEMAKAPPLEARVLVLASDPTAWLRRRLLGLGVDHYVEKPAPLMVADLRTFLHNGRHASR